MFPQVKDTIGRLIPKPEDKTYNEVELYEEAVPITQQIENLRKKIILQERYNAALKDSMEESTEGTFSILRGMFAEVHHLRLSLKEAVNQEKWAVNNALRTHRLFQLALKKAGPNAAMSWIDDKLFDNTKLLNEHIDRLIKKRKRLEETEVAVAFLEKWPVPGSLPWEIELEVKMNRICVSQSSTKVRLECAKVLYDKYVLILNKLRAEQNLYAPIVNNLSSQLHFQLQELRHLEQMLGDAQIFQKEAEEKLQWTEKEASANRKHRRAHITRMRKEMHKLVEYEQMSMEGRLEGGLGPGKRTGSNKKATIYQYQSLLLSEEVENKQNDRLAAKRAAIDTFNDHAALLVDIMKIPNLTHIPNRLESVLLLNDTLRVERKMKEQLKHTLIKQKDQLAQLFCIIRHTGSAKIDQYNKVILDYQQALNGIESANVRLRNILTQDANLIQDIQLAIASLMLRTDGLDKRPIHIKNSEHLLQVLSIFNDKLKKLSDSLTDLRKEVRLSAGTIKRFQSQLPHTTPARYLRVGSPVEAEEAEGSDDEDFEDYKVPGRVEIKQASMKIVEQALLRKRIAAQEAERQRRRTTDPMDSDYSD